MTVCWVRVPPQAVGEREAEVARLQAELARLRQELQDKATQEDALRQQMSDKEEKTRKAIVGAKQKINQLMGEGNPLLPCLTFSFTFLAFKIPCFGLEMLYYNFAVVVPQQYPSMGKCGSFLEHRWNWGMHTSSDSSSGFRAVVWEPEACWFAPPG